MKNEEEVPRNHEDCPRCGRYLCAVHQQRLARANGNWDAISEKRRPR